MNLKSNEHSDDIEDSRPGRRKKQTRKSQVVKYVIYFCVILAVILLLFFTFTFAFKFRLLSAKKPLYQIEKKAEYVKQMMKHAWSAYKQKAFGYDHLRPITQDGTNHHSGSMAFTVVDSLDTLYLMGLIEEFNEAKAYVSSQSEKYDQDNNISVFETTIRVVGGLISAYELSQDYMFINHVVGLMEKIIKAFETKNGIPDTSINVLTGYHFSSSPNMAEIGSNILELTRLRLLGIQSIRWQLIKIWLPLKSWIIGTDYIQYFLEHKATDWEVARIVFTSICLRCIS